MFWRYFTVFLKMAGEVFKIRSLGALYFSNFKLLILLLNIETLVFFCNLYVLFFGLGSHSSWHVGQKSGPSLCLGVFMGSWPVLSPVHNLGLRSQQRMMFGFVSLSVQSLSFSLLFQPSWPVAKRSPQLFYALPRGVEYFGQTIILAKHVSLRLNDVSKISVIQAGFPLGMSTDQATSPFEG